MTQNEHGQMLNKIFAQGNIQIGPTNANQFQFPPGFFPVKSVEQLQELNNMLLTNEAAKLKLVLYFYL